MPNHAHCCVPHCTNGKSSCKWGLFEKNGKYEKRRLCGVAPDGCKYTAEVCKNLSFHRLPAGRKLRAEWMAKIRRENLPQNCNTYVCGVHFGDSSEGGGRRLGLTSVPSKFLWSTLSKTRTTRVSAAARSSATTAINPACQSVLPEGLQLSEPEGIGDQLVECPHSGKSGAEDQVSGTRSAADRNPWQTVVVRHLQAQVHSLQTENIKLSDSLQAVKSRATTLEYYLEAVQKENEQLKERLHLCSLSYDRLKKTKSLLKFYTGL